MPFFLADYDCDAHDRFDYGDARRCPRHPHITTSSPDGMFDAPCNACEREMERCPLGCDAYADADSRCDACNAALALGDDFMAHADDDPVVALRMGHPVRLSDIDDDVPF